MRTLRARPGHPVLWAGWTALAAGAVLCVIGWYGVSGERFAERQLPYLASGTIPGAALIVAGAVLLARGRDAVAAARVEELYRLLVAEQPPGEERRTDPGPVAVSRELRAVPGGTLFHRADCPLVTGRTEAVAVDAELRARRELRPCPVCEPAAADT
ncbi:hypothetical protein [Streptomyces sp. NPDC093094]|uniref:hypothetical protein n=1 Tax=Streptomyces sp. NPDC093094 TaxID=3366026 RepID=UPI0037FF47EB